MASSKIQIVDSSFGINVSESINEVVVGNSGPQGPQGIAGRASEIDYSSLSHVHTQSVSSDIWTIVHGLGFVPNMTVVDSAGSVVEGDYSYPDENTIIVTFIGGFTGKAYLS